MLVTRVEQEVRDFPFVWATGTKAWRAVTFELAIAYILVNVEHQESDFLVNEKSVLWREDDVLEICRQRLAVDGRRLTGVALLLPASDGRSAGWRIESVNEVWSHRSLKASPPRLSYYRTDGSRIVLPGDVRAPKGARTLEFSALY